MEYTSPLVMIIGMDPEMILCASLGETQNYNSQDIWNLGEEN
jgi:hypothetical protein